ncbi:unnamed protein product [Closterium sp. Naga37s-1]|nr:unnamed protein product [Closterium sp. Naga37s-1]
MSLATLTPPGSGARPFVANASPAATVSHQKTRLEKQQQQQLQQQEEQEQEPLRPPPLFRLDRFFGSAPDSIWKTPGESASNGEIGGAGEKKRGQADDAGGKEGGGGGGTWLIDPGDGTSGEGAEFPPAELFTVRNFPVRLPRRKGKRRKGDREEDVGGKTNPGTVEGGSVGQDSWVLPVTGDRFPVTPYQDVIKAGERNVDSYHSCSQRPRLGAHRNKLNPKHALPLLPGPPLSPPPLSPSPLSPPPLSPPPLSPPPLSPPPLSPPPLSPPPLSPPPLSPPPDTPIRAVGDQRGDQRGDHDVAHIEMSEPKNPPPLLPLTVLLKCPHPPIHNSLPRLNTNLTMLLGAEDDGVYDVDMRVTLYSPLPPIPCLPSATSNLTMLLGAEDDGVYDVDMRVTRVINLTMLLGAEDDGVYDVDMRVTLYRNWFDKSGQRQPKARWGRVHGWMDGWMAGKGWSGGGMDGLLRCLKGLKQSGEGVNGCRDGSWMEGKGWSGGGMDGLLRCLKGLKQSGEGVNGCKDGSWIEGKGWSGGGMDGVMDGERQWNGRLGGEMEAWRDG